MATIMDMTINPRPAIPHTRERQHAGGRQLRLDINDRLIVDLFAGGGGISLAVEKCLGRHVDVACNHNPVAMDLHKRNHPQSEHYISDVWEVDPRHATQGRKVGLLHLSPDCCHHSQAAAGQPRDKAIRALTWVGLRWAGTVQPEVIELENVVQLLDWGPLVAKRCPETGRVVKRDGSVAAAGERVPVRDQFLVPDKKRKGRYWRQFVASLVQMGYEVEWRALDAKDFGAATTRIRLFMVARCDGRPIQWPTPTRHPQGTAGQGYEAAANHINWSLPCPSIFLDPVTAKRLNVRRPLKPASLTRIAIGLDREVLSGRPFIVPRAGQHPGDGCEAAFIGQANAGFNTRFSRPISEPLSTITTTGSQQQLVVANLITLRRNCASRSVTQPISTITAGAEHHGLVQSTLTQTKDAKQALRVADFLCAYLPRLQGKTLSKAEKLALVTVTVDGRHYWIADIGMRMLSPRELFRCQGFDDDYEIAVGASGVPLTKAAQIMLVGNSVSPKLAMALIAINCWHLAAHRQWRQRGRAASRAPRRHPYTTPTVGARSL